MLRQSFIFLPQISERKERKIWQHANDWNEFLEKPIPGINDKLKHGYNQIISAAKNALLQDNAPYFARLFPSVDQWRLYDHFKGNAAFLDIETASNYGDITVIGISDGNETKTLIRGINLDKETLKEALKPYQMLVTFNGKSFDVPVIQKYFNLPFDMPHIDLKHVCRNVGLVGGLKSIEKEMGIKRPESIKHVRGDDACELWRCWKATGDRDFLDMLVTYNAEDCVNLKTIADQVIPKVWEKTRQSI
jgi:uncharacterized protein YprB with RNaseH-like and TPR domain